MCLGVLKCRLRITLEKTQQYYLMTLCLVAIGKANVAVLCAWCRGVRFVPELGKIDAKRDKSGTFSDQFFRQAKIY